MNSRKTKYSVLGAILALVVLYLVLMIPSSEPAPQRPGDKTPFVWNQDEYWSALETRFVEAGGLSPDSLDRTINRELDTVNTLLDSLGVREYAPDNPIFGELETAFFETAPLIGASPGRLEDYINVYTRLRRLVKERSVDWEINTAVARTTIYRLLYGGRIAVEEIMLQSPDSLLPALVPGDDEPSSCPSAELLGVTLHSGDLLVSRGGAPTSALIARGNDFPGNFSHAALVHVDDQSGNISIIESHIEFGVKVASVDDYLKDKKLRIMVLRLRRDLPPLIEDPFLPHKAAQIALSRARLERTPYDFEMDYTDHSALFCSEVASAPYEKLGIHLWMGVSHISSVGLRSWLAAFGVTHFETQEPSDLEYDPQLRVVAEWRDLETLFNDHVDNAVIDVMLEGAEEGDQLRYHAYKLPFARLAKVYSVILNMMGGVGPVPEGMSATAALRNEWFSARHRAIKQQTLRLADEFQNAKGYRPPYWELVKLARQAKRDLYGNTK
jgi:hypothetical protein